MEPDENKHHIFGTYAEAIESYMQLPQEIQEKISAPRQSHGCWIIDKEQA